MIGNNSHIWTPLNLDAKIGFDPTIQGNIVNGLDSLAKNGVMLNINTANQTNETDNYRRNWNFVAVNNNLTLSGVATQQSIISGDWSIFFRTKFDSVSVNQMLSGQQISLNAIFLQFLSTGEIRFRCRSTSFPRSTMDTTSNSMSINTWYNILFTRTGNDVKVYVDNVELTTTWVESQSSVTDNLTNAFSGGYSAGLMSLNDPATPVPTAGNLEAHWWFDKVLSDNERDLLHNYYTYN